MYLHVYLICTQGPKMLSDECCLSYVFPLYIILEKGVRGRFTPPPKTNVKWDWSTPHPFTVLHFRDQFMIGLPRLFAH